MIFGGMWVQIQAGGYSEQKEGNTADVEGFSQDARVRDGN